MVTTLYYSRGSYSWAPHMLLEELGEPFEARRVDATRGENRTPEYLKLHPRGHVPVLVQGDFVLTETTAILFHLSDSHPRLGLSPAPGTHARARAYEWCGFFSTAIHVAVRQAFRPERFTTDPAGHPGVVASGLEALKRFYAEVEARLDASGGPYALGEKRSVVDYFLPVFHRWGHRRSLDMTPYPVWQRHMDSMLARPFVQATMEREEITPTGLK